jgi:hypothetical protein
MLPKPVLFQSQRRSEVGRAAEDRENARVLTRLAVVTELADPHPWVCDGKKINWLNCGCCIGKYPNLGYY